MLETDAAIKTPDGTLDAFICRPEEGGPHPAVIMYMDAPGIREELRDMARRIATVGYYVVLPNLYYRTGTEGHYGFDLKAMRGENGQAEAAKMFAVMGSLNNELVTQDTSHLLAHIRSDAAASDGPVGCTGYCMSGQYVTTVAAAFPDDFGAVASFYGVGIVTDKPDSPHLNLAKIKAELYLGFASNDPYVPDGVIDQLKEILAGCDAPSRVEIHPDTEHGFAFPQRPAYHKQAAERHWERLFALFDRGLRGR